MRIICTEYIEVPPETCFPSEIGKTFGIFAGIWGIIVALTG